MTIYYSFSGPIERQNVLLAQAVFDESTINALFFYGEHGHPDFIGTAKFLQIISNWWKTVNVKSPNLARRKRDQLREPINGQNLIEKTSFLRGFVDWLTIWEDSIKGHKSGLSKETFMCAKHSTAALANLSEHLLEEENFEYFLTGKAQSDKLEHRFGKSRQMSGGNLYASVRQFLESDRTIQIKNLAKLNLSLSEIKDLFTESLHEKNEKVEEIADQIFQCLNSTARIEQCPQVPSTEANILFYVAGRFALSLCNKENCLNCKEHLVSTQDDSNFQVVNIPDKDSETEIEKQYLNQVNRGGLTIPSEFIFMTCVQAWNYHSLIVKDPHLSSLLFTPNISAQKIFQHSFLKYLDSNESSSRFFLLNLCKSGHSSSEHVFQIAGKIFNLFSKNFVSDKNSEIHSLKGRKEPEAKREPTKIKVAKLQSDKL